MAPEGQYMNKDGDPVRKVILTLRPHDNGWPRYSVASQQPSAGPAYTKHCQLLTGQIGYHFAQYLVSGGIGAFVQPMNREDAVTDKDVDNLKTLHFMLKDWVLAVGRRGYAFDIDIYASWWLGLRPHGMNVFLPSDRLPYQLSSRDVTRKRRLSVDLPFQSPPDDNGLLQSRTSEAAASGPTTRPIKPVVKKEQASGVATPQTRPAIKKEPISGYAPWPIKKEPTE